MLKNVHKINRTYLLFFIALLSLLGPSLVYLRHFSPQFMPPHVSGFRTDGWVEDGATLSLPKLSAGLNRLKLFVKRGSIPADRIDTQVTVFMGAEEVAQFAASATEPRVNVPLKGDCNPCSIKIVAPEGFRPAEHARTVAFELNRGYIKSALYFPILEWRWYFYCALLLLTFSVATWFFTRLNFFVIALCVTPLSSAIVVGEMLSIEGLWSVPLALAALAFYIGWSSKGVLSNTADQSRSNILLLAAITICALIVRLYGIDFGLPGNHFHPDEEVKSDVIIGMINRNTLDPHYFKHPSLLLYLTLASFSLLKFLHLLPAWEIADQIILSGRLISVLAGTLSVPLVYFIAKYFLSNSAALFSAALLAIVPLHVSLSRYLKEDALLTFGILLTVLFSLRLAQREDLKSATLSGIAAGIACATKYTGVLAAPLVGIGILLNWKRVDWKNWSKLLLVSAFSTVITFFLIAPFILLNYKDFKRDLAKESKQVAMGHMGAIDPWEHLWSYHLGTSLLEGMTLPLLFVSIIGLGMLAKNSRRTLIIPLLFLYFYLPAEYVPGKNARYILPALPFLLFGAAQVFSSAQKLSQRVPMYLLCFGVPLSLTVYYSANVRPDTREDMAAWIGQNIKTGTTFLQPFKAYGAKLPDDKFKTVRPSIGAKRYVALNDVEIERVGADYILFSSNLYDPIFEHNDSSLTVRVIFARLFNTHEFVHLIPGSSRVYLYHNPTTVLIGPRGKGGDSMRQQILKSLNPRRDLGRFKILP